MSKKHIKPIVKNDTMKLFSEVRDLILSARKAVVQSVNTLQVITNFEIGQRIVEYVGNKEVSGRNMELHY